MSQIKGNMKSKAIKWITDHGILTLIMITAAVTVPVVVVLTNTSSESNPMNTTTISTTSPTTIVTQTTTMLPATTTTTTITTTTKFTITTIGTTNPVNTTLACKYSHNNSKSKRLIYDKDNIAKDKTQNYNFLSLEEDIHNIGK